MKTRKIAIVAEHGESTTRDSWHEGRTFYACPCGAQSELGREALVHPLVLDCWHCDAQASMAQWIPPAVKRERDATAALSADVQGNLL